MRVNRAATTSSITTTSTFTTTSATTTATAPTGNPTTATSAPRHRRPLSRAVFVYQIESYRYWQEQLGRTDFIHGQFGENFTITGLPDDVVCIGDRFQVGSALFEISQPRVTCYRVGIRMNEDVARNEGLNAPPRAAIRVGSLSRLPQGIRPKCGSASHLHLRRPGCGPGFLISYESLLLILVECGKAC